MGKTLSITRTCAIHDCRDGFWLHRLLQAHGITNRVVYSSVIEVNRRRRAKSDGLDVRRLLSREFEIVQNPANDRPVGDSGYDPQGL